VPAYSLAIWHGFNLPLLMSVIALAGGVLLYLLLQRACAGLERRRCSAAWRRSASSSARMVFLSWRLARRAEGVLGTGGCSRSFA
jgi:multicomponent K+:H+ antiporter subunit A